LEGRTPYEKVILFDEVKDEKGQTMHKSGQNVIWLDEAFEKTGADSLRWVYLTTKFDQKVLFGYSLGKDAQQKLTYLVNIATYVSKFMKTSPKQFSPKKPEDTWFLSKLERTNKLVTENMEALQSYESARLIEDFMVETFSKEYIKYIRNRTDDENVINMMYHGLLKTLQMISPFTPFLSEHLYQKYFRKFEKAESIHLLDWPMPDESLISDSIEAQMGKAQQVIEAALAKRNELGINLRQPLAKLTTNAEKLGSWTELIAEQANVKEVIYDAASETAVLDATLTEPLKREGRTRELVRQIQDLRKKMGLTEKDLIAVSLSVMLDVDFDHVKKVTNSRQIDDAPMSGAQAEKKVKIDDAEVSISAKKI
ncbi:MAG: class I tRNA ligase family protein, partial [Candidatus Micrarchaeota archaeon]